MKKAKYEWPDQCYFSCNRNTFELIPLTEEATELIGFEDHKINSFLYCHAKKKEEADIINIPLLSYI